MRTLTLIVVGNRDHVEKAIHEWLPHKWERACPVEEKRGTWRIEKTIRDHSKAVALLTRTADSMFGFRGDWSLTISP